MRCKAPPPKQNLLRIPLTKRNHQKPDQSPQKVPVPQNHRPETQEMDRGRDTETVQEKTAVPGIRPVLADKVRASSPLVRQPEHKKDVLDSDFTETGHPFSTLAESLLRRLIFQKPYSYRFPPE